MLNITTRQCILANKYYGQQQIRESYIDTKNTRFAKIKFIQNMEMTDNMREYLRQRFYRNNHSKYRKYFEEWLNGVVGTQLMYFEKEKYRLENNVVLK